MSDLLASAAIALGIPDSLVQRSADARAAESGATVDEILAAWVGGAPAPSTDPAPVSTEAQEPAEASVAEETEAPSSSPVATTDPTTAAPIVAPSPDLEQVVASTPYKAPVLVGAQDNPMTILVGAIGLFVVVLLVGLIGPSLQLENPGARTSNIAFTDEAAQGQDIYASLGCASCHTQLVRPVIADVGLGDVTLNDSNQILGTRRFGPDLSNVGARMTAVEITATVDGTLGNHPTYVLSLEDISSLASYLSASQTVGSES